MIELIFIFGALILFAGIIMIVNPELIFAYLRNNLDKPEIQILAVVVRLAIGVLLISQSSLSRYPFVIEIIGWLSIAAALSMAVMGRQNFKRLLTWALSLTKPFGRPGGVVAAAFGGFLIYVFT